MATAKVTATLPLEVVLRVRELAEREGLSEGRIVREALEGLLRERGYTIETGRPKRGRSRRSRA